MICKDDESLIVLMTKAGIGTVLREPIEKEWSIGLTSSAWEMSCFVDFEGQLILENS